MKFIIPFLLLVSSACYGQNVVYHDYSPTVKGVVIGNVVCTFWFHDSVYTSALAAGFDLEAACYDGAANVLLAFKRVDGYLDGGYVFGPNNVGYVRVFANKSFDFHDPSLHLIDFSLAAKGPDDTTDFLVKITI